MPFVMSGGSRIHYAVAGSGPPLLLHGGLSDTPAFVDLGWVAALQDQYHVLVLDARGHGASDKPHDPAQYSREHWVDDVLAVLDAEHIDQAHYCGYSLGAWVGFGVGVRAPERCRSLVLGGFHPFAIDRAAWGGMPAFMARGMEPLAAQLEQGLGERFTLAMRHRLLGNDPLALSAAAEAMLAAPSLEQQLPAMTVPTLIFCGEQDPNFSGAEHAGRVLPNATFVPMAGFGHELGFYSELLLPLVTDFLERMRVDGQARA